MCRSWKPPAETSGSSRRPTRRRSPGVINNAFIVETFFIFGPRTNTDEIVELMESGEFLITEDTAGAITGCVYT